MGYARRLLTQRFVAASIATESYNCARKDADMERYRKIKQIGTGSFGQAWLVESTVSRRTYALKELGVTAMSEQDRQLALNEANILSQLKHKNVVRYKEAFFAEGKLCIAMEYAEKGE